MLPRLDGWEFLNRVKADAALADIPVIIVSMVDEPGKGYALGAAKYLTKPVNRDELLATLRHVTSGVTSGRTLRGGCWPSTTIRWPSS